MTARADGLYIYNGLGVGSSWNNSFNWRHLHNPFDLFPLDDGTIPGLGDSASISGNHVVRLNVDSALLNSFSISSGSTILTDGNRLTVSNGSINALTSIDGNETKIFVVNGDPSRDFDTDILNISNGGELDMTGGIAHIDATMDVDANSIITGVGTIVFNNNINSSGVIFEIDGTIRAGSGTLSIVANSGGTVDLDGSNGNTLLDLSSSGNFIALVIDATISDTFGGTIQIASSNRLEFVRGWSLNGDMTMTGGRLDGSTFNQTGGSIDIDSGTNTINPDITRTSGNLTVDSGATLNINGSSTFSGPASTTINGTASVDGASFNGVTIGGSGLLHLNDTININGNTTINTTTLNWDGGMAATFIRAGNSLTINSDVIDDAGDGYDGTVTLETGASLTVNTAAPWGLEGRMNLNGATVSGRKIEVSERADDTFAAIDALTGTSTIATTVDFDAGANLTVSSGAVLNINGSGTSVRFEPGSDVVVNGTLVLEGTASTTWTTPSTVNGSGTIVQNMNSIVVGGETAINVAVYDWDGTNPADQLTTILSGASLTLNVDAIDSGSDGFDDSVTLVGSTLTVNTPGAWEMEGTMVLNTVSGTVNVNGSLMLVHPGSNLGSGSVTVTGGGTANVNAATEWNNGAKGSIAANTTLQLNANSDFTDVSITGDGTLAIDSTASIQKFASIAVGSLNIQNDGNVTMDDGRVSVSNFTRDVGGSFDFNGGAFLLESGDGVYNGSFVFSGPNQAASPTLAITDGGDFAVTFSFQVGSTAGEFGAALVSGVNGSRRSTIRGTGGGAGADLIVGVNGIGALGVSNGGLVDLRDDFILGNGATGDGTVLVDGVNGSFRSTVEANNGGGNSVVQIGRSGVGNLRIENGGLVTTSGDAFVGQIAGSTGTLTIGGSSGGFDATLDVADDMGIGGSAGAAGGTGNVTINGGGRLDVGDILTVWDAGTLTINGGTINAATINITNGRLEGNGNLEINGGTVSNAGVVAPGGDLSINDGDYTQTTAGSLEIQLATPLMFDTLNVAGTANLDGVLDVSFFNGISPIAGNTFEILTAGLISGTFGVENLPDLGGLSWNVNYGTTNVVLEVTSPFTADFDGDGDVDADDLGDWQLSFGLNADADADGDSDSDGADFLDWQRQFGSGVPTLASSQNVPEPSTLWLALVGVAFLSRRRKISFIPCFSPASSFRPNLNARK